MRGLAHAHALQREWRPAVAIRPAGAGMRPPPAATTNGGRSRPPSPGHAPALWCFALLLRDRAGGSWRSAGVCDRSRPMIRPASERISRHPGWENAPALTGEAVAFSARWTGLLDALSSTLGHRRWPLTALSLSVLPFVLGCQAPG